MQRPRRSIVVYGIALIAIAGATSIRLALDEVLGEHLMYSMYYFAVSVAAWAGGIRPAMITAILSSILANYIFHDPRGDLVAGNWEEIVGLPFFSP
jgi:K+-sensing histidine kinase KdpD